MLVGVPPSGLRPRRGARQRRTRRVPRRVLGAHRSAVHCHQEDRSRELSSRRSAASSSRASTTAGATSSRRTPSRTSLTSRRPSRRTTASWTCKERSSSSCLSFMKARSTRSTRGSSPCTATRLPLRLRRQATRLPLRLRRQGHRNVQNDGLCTARSIGSERVAASASTVAASRHACLSAA